MKNFSIFIVLFFILFSTAFFNTRSVKAEEVDLLKTAGGQARFNLEEGDDEYAFPKVTGRFINVFLSFIGVIFIVLMFYAGFTWMTARGNDEAVNKAKDTLMNAGIGLAVVVTAYAVVYFVLWLIAGKYGGDESLGKTSYHYELNIDKDKNYV